MLKLKFLNIFFTYQCKYNSGHPEKKNCFFVVPYPVVLGWVGLWDFFFFFHFSDEIAKLQSKKYGEVQKRGLGG